MTAILNFKMAASENRLFFITRVLIQLESWNKQLNMHFWGQGIQIWQRKQCIMSANLSFQYDCRYWTNMSKQCKPRTYITGNNCIYWCTQFKYIDLINKKVPFRTHLWEPTLIPALQPWPHFWEKMTSFWHVYWAINKRVVWMLNVNVAIRACIRWRLFLMTHKFYPNNSWGVA